MIRTHQVGAIHNTEGNVKWFVIDKLTLIFLIVQNSRVVFVIYLNYNL